MVLVQGAVGGKVPGFLRVLDIFKIWICQSQGYRYFSGRQKWPALATSNQQGMMVTAITTKSMFRLLTTFVLKYMPEEGEVDPNGKLF